MAYSCHEPTNQTQKSPNVSEQVSVNHPVLLTY